MARPLVVASTDWGIIPLWNVERNLTCFSTDSRQPNARPGSRAKIYWTRDDDLRIQTKQARNPTSEQSPVHPTNVGEEAGDGAGTASACGWGRHCSTQWISTPCGTSSSALGLNERTGHILPRSSAGAGRGRAACWTAWARTQSGHQGVHRRAQRCL